MKLVLQLTAYSKTSYRKGKFVEKLGKIDLAKAMTLVIKIHDILFPYK